MSDHIRDNRDNLLRVADALERIERHLAALITKTPGNPYLTSVGDGYEVLMTKQALELPICPMCDKPVRGDEKFRQVETQNYGVLTYHAPCWYAHHGIAEGGDDDPYRYEKDRTMEEAEGYRRAHLE